jgi:glyoxylase-like metal-dependent hydrolase (beta-lactamase superfamily II)
MSVGPRVENVFERLSIPTPFEIGPVNTYLAGRTLVDPGPDSDEAWSTLLSELRKRDLGPDDVERVLVTHPHPDHFGLAQRLRDEGADVCVSERTARIIADFGARLAYEQEFFRPFLERHGVSAGTARTVTQLPQVFLEYTPPVKTDRILARGDRVDIEGRAVEVLAVSGHAPGELVFTFNDGDHGDDGNDVGRSAVVGDHVLGDSTPNPLLQPPPPESDDETRPRVLPAFNRSLGRLREMEFWRILPGHREEITDATGRIDEILAANESRTEAVAELVDGPTTAVEVMEGLFGDLPATEVFPGMSEAIGHLDVLEERDRVTTDRRGGMVVYEPVDGNGH